MRRVFKKTIGFCMALLICLSILKPAIVAYADEVKDYMIKVIVPNEYSDAVRFGDGYLLLKDGKFDNITSKTRYFFVDEKGNEREIKNNVGFTEIYLNTSGSTYYVDYGALAIGKDGKVALMDMNGELYGGDTNFYSCVVYAGDNLFYTTNDTENETDKANTQVWTLRKKDGSVVKEFNNLNFPTERVHSNGYEYLMTKINGKNQLICINQQGSISKMGDGYLGYTVYGDLGYVKAYKISESGKGYFISIFNMDGTKAFEIDNCYSIDLEGLSNFGYASAWLSYNGNDCGTLVDKNGKMIFELGKYTTISDYDDKQAIAIDENANMFLVDYSDNVIFDVDKFAKGFGESYSAITFSSYYIDSTLTVSIVDNSKENDVGKSFFFDSKGNQISGEIKGTIAYYEGFNGSYASIYDNESESYGVVNKKGDFEKRGYEYLKLQNDPKESNVDAVADKSSDNSKIIIMSDGRDINKYDQFGEGGWYGRQFVNGHVLVKLKGKQQYGIMDINGNEIIPVGEYESFIQYDDSECIVAYKNGAPYLFDTNGNVLNISGQYKNIGEYVTSFYKFASYGNYTVYKDHIGSNNVTITRDYSDKLGLVKIIDTDYMKSDINGDGKVDILDISMIATLYNLKSSDPKWNSKMDINSDNIIDIYDLIVVSKNI